MVKGSALYIVIVIALVVAIICSSLIVTAFYYRLEYQKTFRYSQLQTNLTSAENIVLADEDTVYKTSKTFSLFQLSNDTVSTQKIFWGAFDIDIVKAFIQSDTLFKVFSIANTIDSSKWTAIYLTNNERQLALSGKTLIRGNVDISPSGVTQAFLDNHGYLGNKRLVIGKIQVSAKTLPILNPERIKNFESLIFNKISNDTSLNQNDSLQKSFLNPTHIISLGKKITTLSNITLSGNIILLSDTLLNIDSTSVLNNVIVYAQSINIKSGFKCTCQIFARDTIGVAQNCQFDYPSALGLLNFNKLNLVTLQAKIAIQNKCTFMGLIFTYQKYPGKVPPLIDIGANVKIQGQVYSQGNLEFKTNDEIDGSVFSDRFLYQTAFARYENYLNNIIIDEQSLSPYYLTSDLIPVAAPKRKVLQWLEQN